LLGRAVPQVKLDGSKIDRTPLNPVPPAKCGSCLEPLLAKENGQVADLLAAAAHYRMRRKAQRIRQAA